MELKTYKTLVNLLLAVVCKYNILPVQLMCHFKSHWMNHTNVARQGHVNVHCSCLMLL